VALFPFSERPLADFLLALGAREGSLRMRPTPPGFVPFVLIALVRDYPALRYYLVVLAARHPYPSRAHCLPKSSGTWTAVVPEATRSS